MVLTAQEIVNTRNHTLNNLLGLSGACLEASQRLSQLLTASTREALQHGSRQWSQLGHGQWETASQFPTALWLEHSSRRAGPVPLDRISTAISGALRGSVIHGGDSRRSVWTVG